GNPPIRQQVIEAHQHHVNAVDRHDLLGVLERRGALELHDDHGGVVEHGGGFGRREGAEMEMRQAAGVRALAERRKFGRRHDRLGFVRRADVRRDHSERAAVEHAGDIVRRVGGNAHERRDPGFERGHADLAAGVEREARMLDVDIERIEAGGAGDAGDLDGAHEPHRHRRHHLVPLELLLYIVVQDVAYRHGGVSFFPWAMLPGATLAASKHRLSMNYTTDFKSIRAEVSAEEWQARVDLTACYRLVDKYGMTDLIYNHITARIPGSKDHLLINLYGMLYKE